MAEHPNALCPNGALCPRGVTILFLSPCRRNEPSSCSAWCWQCEEVNGSCPLRPCQPLPWHARMTAGGCSLGAAPALLRMVGGTTLEE